MALCFLDILLRCNKHRDGSSVQNNIRLDRFARKWQGKLVDPQWIVTRSLFIRALYIISHFGDQNLMVEGLYATPSCVYEPFNGNGKCREFAEVPWHKTRRRSRRKQSATLTLHREWLSPSALGCGQFKPCFCERHGSTRGDCPIAYTYRHSSLS